MSVSLNIQDDEYASLIAGNLTKEELEFVLSEGLETYREDGIEESEYKLILNLLFAEGVNDEFVEVHDYQNNSEGWYMIAYSLTDVNRLFSSFTDFQYSEENDNDDTENGVYVDGDNISIQEATKAWVEESATITSAEYTAEEMVIYYTYESIQTDSDDRSQYITIRNNMAVLEPTDEGLYRIVSIINIEDETLASYEEVLNAYATIFYSSDTLGEGETVDALAVFSQYGCEIGETGKSGKSGIFNPWSVSYTFQSGSGIENIYAGCIDLNSDGIMECIVSLQDEGSKSKEYVDVWTLENGEPKWVIGSYYRDMITLCENGVMQEVAVGGAADVTYIYYQLQGTTLELLETTEDSSEVEGLEEKYPYVNYIISWNTITDPSDS